MLLRAGCCLREEEILLRPSLNLGRAERGVGHPLVAKAEIQVTQVWEVIACQSVSMGGSVHSELELSELQRVTSKQTRVWVRAVYGCCLDSRLLSFPLPRHFPLLSSGASVWFYKHRWRERSRFYPSPFQSMSDLLVMCCALNLIDCRMFLLQPDHLLLLDLIRFSCQWQGCS